MPSTHFFSFGATGGAAPSITLRAPLYTENFNTYADGTRLVAGDPNANYGLGATNPGNLGWSAYTSTTTNDAKHNYVIHGGKLTARTSGAAVGNRHLITPNIDVTTHIAVKYLPGAGTNSTVEPASFLVHGQNEANALYLHVQKDNSLGVTGFVIRQRIAGTVTDLVSRGTVGTVRRRSGNDAATASARNASFNEDVRLITYNDGTNNRAVIRRGPGWTIGADAGYTYTDPGGDKFGFIDSSAQGGPNSIDNISVNTTETFLTITETNIREFVPKRRASSSDAITSGSANISFTGLYYGTAPVKLQWALCDPETGAIVKDWALVPSATIGSGAWTANSLNIPCGLNGRKAYQIGFRPVNALNEADELQQIFSRAFFYVSMNILAVGQSNAKYLGNSNSSGATTQTPGRSIYNPPDPPSVTFGTMGNVADYYYTTAATPGAAYWTMLDKISEYLNIPVSLEILAIPARHAFDLDPLSGPNVAWFAAHHAFGGGAFDMIVLSQGENEQSSSGDLWYSQWVNNNFPSYLTMSGQPSGTTIPIFYWYTGTVFPGGSVGTAPQIASTVAMRLGQDALASASIANTEIIPAAHYVGVEMIASEPHYVNVAGKGNSTNGRRVAQSILKWLGASTYSGLGPFATSASRSGAVITIPVNLNGAASLSARNGNDETLTASTSALTSWEVSNDDFATTLTQTSVVLSGSNVVITLAADPGGPVKVMNYQRRVHDISSWVSGEYADGSTILMKPVITPLTSN